MFVVGGVRAESMCVTSNLNFVVLRANVNGTVQDADDANKRFSILFTDTGYNRRVTGIASCNEIHTTDGTESGTSVTQNYVETRLRAGTDDVGQYCWCKWEPVYDSSNTTYYPKKIGLASYWQYLKSYETDTACASDCATACANAIANNTDDFRKVMFNSLW